MEGSSSKAQICRQPCFRCYHGLCLSAREENAKSLPSAVTLYGAVLRERNAPAAATSTRECGTTAATSNQINGMSNATFTCLAAQINTATGHEPRSRCTCSPPSSTVRKTQSSAVDLELTPQLFADQKNRRRPSHTGRGRRPHVPATGCSELLFPGTPLQRILPHCSKIKSAWHAVGGSVQKKKGGTKPRIRTFCDVWLSSGTRDSVVAPQRLTRRRRQCRLLLEDIGTIFPWCVKYHCLYYEVSACNRPAGKWCQLGERDSCKLPVFFTRNQRPFCDEFCSASFHGVDDGQCSCSNSPEAAGGTFLACPPPS